MPTFSARLSPKSHFPGPKTGIVFGLFLSVVSFQQGKHGIPLACLLNQCKQIFCRIQVLLCHFAKKNFRGNVMQEVELLKNAEESFHSPKPLLC